MTPTGGKLWRWKYRVKGVGKQMSYGKYPDVPLAEARERHAAARKLLASGMDPMAQRKAEKLASRAADTNSFEAIAHLWLEHWLVRVSAMWILPVVVWRLMSSLLLAVGLLLRSKLPNS
jgi:hypothetical protein